jgi:tetratricopeptide (TPR) repeat protein
VVQGMLDDLRLERARLNRLKRDSASVRASFNLSYDRLPAALQQQFAALGVFGGADFSIETIAHVWDAPVEAALADVRALVARSLVQPSREGRYRLHPLLRDFARERLTECDATERTCDERCAAYFAGFVHQHKDDFGALDLEFGNILAALRAAHDRQLIGTYFSASHGLLPYLRARGLYDHGKAIYEQAIRMAEASGDDNELALSLHDLASIVVKQGDYDATITLTEQSLKIATRLGNCILQYQLLAIFALVTANQGRFRDMARYCEQGLAIAQELNDHRSLCTSYINLGVALANLGNFAEGEKYQAEGLRMAKEGGYSEAAMAVSHNLGCLLRDAGRDDEARACFEDGMRLARQVGHRERLCHLLLRLGEMDSEAGRYDLAEAALTEAMVLADDIQMPWTISTAAFSLSNHRLRLEQVAEAASLAERGIAIARKIGSTELIADGLLTQAKVHFARHERAQAIAIGEESLAIYEAQGMNKVVSARQWLDSIR